MPSHHRKHYTPTPSDWDDIDTPINLTCKTGKWEDIEYLGKTQADMGEHTNSTQTWPKLGIDFFSFINIITSKWCWTDGSWGLAVFIPSKFHQVYLWVRWLFLLFIFIIEIYSSCLVQKKGMCFSPFGAALLEGRDILAQFTNLWFRVVSTYKFGKGEIL